MWDRSYCSGQRKCDAEDFGRAVELIAIWRKLLQNIVSLYRTAFSNCFVNRSSNSCTSSLDVNRICFVFSTVLICFGKNKFGMASSHKLPFSGCEFRDIWRNEKRNQFPQFLPTGVKLCVMTLGVILSNMSDFRGNCLCEVCFLLGISPASVVQMPTFRNSLSVPSS